MSDDTTTNDHCAMGLAVSGDLVGYCGQRRGAPVHFDDEVPMYHAFVPAVAEGCAVCGKPERRAIHHVEVYMSGPKLIGEHAFVPAVPECATCGGSGRIPASHLTGAYAGLPKRCPDCHAREEVGR